MPTLSVRNEEDTSKEVQSFGSSEARSTICGCNRPRSGPRLGVRCGAGGGGTGGSGAGVELLELGSWLSGVSFGSSSFLLRSGPGIPSSGFALALIVALLG